MKRLIDIVFSASLLIASSPILLTCILLVWVEDWRSPFYLAHRVARGGGTFRMAKLRSMVIGADRTGVSSTAAGDARVTGVGKLIRKFKIDELTQLWNVLVGDMSVVGPRPNIRAGGVDLYTEVELKLLLVRPGITDFSSIVFSDEGDILAGKADPDIAYNQLIRPWKSRLGLFYVEHSSVAVDLKLIYFTALAILSRRRALKGVAALLVDLGAPPELVAIAQRNTELVPMPPPGAADVVKCCVMNAPGAP